jgi:hypothetical protein
MTKPLIGAINPLWAVTRPDGFVWRRTFATEGAAWRVVIPGVVSPAAFRLRRAEIVRRQSGWLRAAIRVVIAGGDRKRA